MIQKALGKAHRQGISIVELAKMFPDENAARNWFESILWPDGTRICPRCRSEKTHKCSHAKMPYRCSDCRKYFSIKTGTVMENSKLPLLKWVYAIYLDSTSPKGVSSMKLHRDLGIRQATAWHMQQRIRAAFANEGPNIPFGGPVEVDEAYFGGKEGNKHARDKLRAGRGTAGKTAVVGAKDRASNKVRAMVVQSTGAKAIHSSVEKLSARKTAIYTDEARACVSLPDAENKFTRASVKHSVGEFVDGPIHTNNTESFWPMLKRTHKGPLHKLSPKHLRRYIDEFAGRHNVMDTDTIERMAIVANGISRRYQTYDAIIDDSGLSSTAQQAR